jgi:hypothetical protein
MQNNDLRLCFVFYFACLNGGGECSCEFILFVNSPCATLTNILIEAKEKFRSCEFILFVNSLCATITNILIEAKEKFPVKTLIHLLKKQFTWEGKCIPSGIVY